MKNKRNIELECYAVVKATGREVQVTRKFSSLFLRETTWGCDDGKEYLASELRRCSKEVYDQLESERITDELIEDAKEWRAEERADEQAARDNFNEDER